MIQLSEEDEGYRKFVEHASQRNDIEMEHKIQEYLTEAREIR